MVELILLVFIIWLIVQTVRRPKNFPSGKKSMKRREPAISKSNEKQLELPFELERKTIFKEEPISPLEDIKDQFKDQNQLKRHREKVWAEQRDQRVRTTIDIIHRTNLRQTLQNKTEEEKS